MKWVTHYVWAALPLIYVYHCAYLPLVIAYSVTATVLTDMLAHRGRPVPHRTWWHDPWAVAAHSLVAGSIAWSAGLPWLLWAALGALGGFTHVFLDWISPGRKAISWGYNAPALLLGLAIAYYICA